MEAFSDAARDLFVSLKGKLYDQHFFAAIYKAGMLRVAQGVALALGDRCGAQGLMAFNLLPPIHVSSAVYLDARVITLFLQAKLRGAAIAEGDILVTSIREWCSPS